MPNNNKQFLEYSRIFTENPLLIMFLRLRIFSFFLLLAGSLFSQSNKRDSLEKVLDTASGINKVNTLNWLCLETRFSDPDSAMHYGEKGLLLAGKYMGSPSLGYLRNNIGLLYLDKGRYDKALDNFIESERLFEGLGRKRDMAMTYENMGAVYQAQNLYDKALNYFNSAFDLTREFNDKYFLAELYTSFGSVYYDMGNNPRALEYFTQSLRIMEELRNKKGISDGFNNVAVIYEEQKNYKEALYYHNLSLKLARDLQDKIGIAASYHNIGLVYKAKKDYPNAILYVDSAITTAREVDDFNNLHDYYSSLSEIYNEKGDFKSSLEAFQRSAAAKDSALNREQGRQIVEMSAKYETEKKEKQNQIYKQTIDLQELNANRQQIILYAVSALSVLLISLAFFIYRGYRQKKAANRELSEKNLIIEEKSRIVEEKNKDITDSIRYAKRLQEAILKPVRELPTVFPDSFIFFQPKDIVSGDFYWFEKFGNHHLVAAADCTGHGVPGAFMSIIGCNLMSQAVNEYALTRPAVILNSLNKGLSKILHQRMDESVKDGMDIALCAFDPQRMVVEYAGAFNPMWIVRDGSLVEYNGDKFPVGAFVGEQLRAFTNHEVQLQKGDAVYLFSDGYADQFGGPKGKKFKYKQLKQLLISMQGRPMEAQRELLKARLEEWKGGLEQVDDILVIGIRF
jgi:serine phosphatase RsbU (regulator of sigma subunit)